LYTYHLKTILESNGYDNASVIDKLKAWECKYVKDVSADGKVHPMVIGWKERITPAHVPSDYKDLISRLDDGFEYEWEGETYRPTSRVQRSGRIYTTMVSGSKRLCFQGLDSDERMAITWKRTKLVQFDVSASQLRIALALRDVILPFSISPWDILKVDHPVEEELPTRLARELKKVVGILLVRGVRNFSFTQIWVEKLEQNIEHRPMLKGYQGAVGTALLIAFPELDSELKDLDLAPDGYVISHRSDAFKRHDIQCRSLGIKTSFRVYDSEAPTQGNKLEAMEAYVLRKAITALPPGTPVLTCHDQIYVLPEFKDLVMDTLEKAIVSIADPAKMKVYAEVE